MKHSKWKILSSEDVSPSKWFPIVKDQVELSNGKTLEYFRSLLEPAAMVVAVTKERELIFVRQYKHGVREVCLEFPAGRVEHDQSPLQAAVKELAEETGVHIHENQLTPLLELWTEPSKSSVRVHGFFVKDIEVVSQQHLEDSEAIEVVKVPISKVDELLVNGELHASDTVALLLYAKHRFPELLSTR
jgi:ADP-ribose pyrophosphatase